MQNSKSSQKREYTNASSSRLYIFCLLNKAVYKPNTDSDKPRAGVGNIYKP